MHFSPPPSFCFGLDATAPLFTLSGVWDEHRPPHQVRQRNAGAGDRIEGGRQDAGGFRRGCNEGQGPRQAVVQVARRSRVRQRLHPRGCISQGKKR
jgi:hypothetical protein